MFSFNFISFTLFDKFNVKSLFPDKKDLTIDKLNSTTKNLMPVVENVKYIATKSLNKGCFGEVLKMNAKHKIIIYLCIQEKQDQSNYNLITPVIDVNGKQDPYYFNSSCYALEGGGGLNQVKDIFRHAQNLKNNSGEVSFEARVCFNKDLEAFQSNVKIWPTLKNNSVRLSNASGDKFLSINKEYTSLLKEFSFLDN